MARINLARRAQNGLRRRAKSRSQLVQAARALLSIRPADAITVEEVTGNAGSAKGTVYFHFESLDDLRAAVAEDLTCEFDESSSALSHGHRRPGRTDCNRLPGIRQPGIARSRVGRTYRAGDLGISTCRKGDYSRLSEDLNGAIEQERLGSISLEVGFDIVVGVVLQAMRSASRKKLSSRDVPLIVSAVLRVLGLAADQAERIAHSASKLAFPEMDSRHPLQHIEKLKQH